MENNVVHPTSKDDVVAILIDSVNTTKPEHPRFDDPYPITRDDTKIGYCRSDGPYIAKCGPGWGDTVVRFDLDTDYILSMRFENLMAVITHEMAHITHGRHTDGGTHNKPFWREMAFLAWEMREKSDYIGHGRPVSEISYVTSVINEPTEDTVDKRIETVRERREEMASLLGYTTELVK